MKKPVQKKHVAKFLVAFVILFFVIKSIAYNWSQVVGYTWRFHLPLLLLGTVLQWMVLVYFVELWRRWLGHFGRLLPFRKAYRIWFLANLGKYVPGKIWTVVGMAKLTEEQGIPATITVGVAVLNQVLSVLSAFLIVILFAGPKKLANLPPLFYLFFAILIVVALYPRWLLRGINFLLQILKQNPVELKINLAHTFIVTLFFGVGWVGYGLAFFIFLQALGQGQWAQFFSISAAFIFSYLIGFLSLFVPGGLGVREGLLTVALAQFMPTGVAGAVALVSRLWITFVELVALLGIGSGGQQTTSPNKH